MKKNLIRQLSFDFALKIIKLYQHLQKNGERIMSAQLLKCGTSIGANVEEAQAAQSSKDFISKLCISSKESRESRYWLTLLKASGYLDQYSEKEAILEDINSIIKILTKIIKTTTSQDKKMKSNSASGGGS